jgi:hypothetical protein
VTFDEAHWRDGNSLVVGEIIEGILILRAMKDSSSSKGIPLKRIEITNSGELPM